MRRLRFVVLRLSMAIDGLICALVRFQDSKSRDALFREIGCLQGQTRPRPWAGNAQRLANGSSPASFLSPIAVAYCIGDEEDHE